MSDYLCYEFSGRVGRYAQVKLVSWVAIIAALISVETATALSCGGEETGGSVSGPDGVVSYSVSVPVDGAVSINVRKTGGGDDFRARWRLLNENGGLINSSPYTGRKGFNLRGGVSYTVEVFERKEGVSGSFAISMVGLSGATNCGQTLSCGDEIEYRNRYPGDLMVFRISESEGERVSILVRSDADDPFSVSYQILTPGGGLVNASNSSGRDDLEIGTDGVYTVAVSDPNNASVTVRLDRLGGNSCGERISCDQTRLDSIAEKGDSIYYRFLGAEGERLSIEVADRAGGGDFRTRWRLFGPDGKAVGFRTSGAKTRTPSETGIHTLRVFDASNDATGEFEVTVRGNPAFLIDARDFNDRRWRRLADDDSGTRSLANRGRRVIGLAADGVSAVLLRVTGLDSNEPVSFILNDGSGGPPRRDVVGILDDPFDPTTSPELRDPSDPGETFVVVTPRPLGNSFAAFAVLYPPFDFAAGDGSDDAGWANPREIVIEAEQSPSSVTCPASDEIVLELHRPPVVLLHGLRGTHLDWQWKLRLDARFHVTVADYRRKNEAFFLNNRYTAGRWIRRAIARMRRGKHPFDIHRPGGIAVTQADVFGHSMGGILTRLYALDLFEYEERRYVTKFRRRDNFELGDIHKLVTVDTPHYGSPVANMLVTADNHITPFGAFAESVSDAHVTRGATRDLRTDSQILGFLNSHDVDLPVSAIVGVGGSESPGFSIPDIVYWGRTAVLTLACHVTLEEFFGGPHDLVVSAESQMAGLEPDYVYTVNGREGWHYQVVNRLPDGDANRFAELLLNQPLRRFRRGFPVNAVPPFTPPCSADLLIESPCSGPCPVRLFAEVDGETIEAGEQSFAPEVFRGATIPLRAEFELDSLLPVLSVWFSSSNGDVAVDLTPPFETEFQVSDRYLGPLTVYAVARVRGPLGVVPSRSPDLQFQVVSDQNLARLVLEPTSLNLHAYAPTEPVRLLGVLADGTVVDVSPSAVGVSFESLDEDVADLQEDGTAVAHRVGETVGLVRAGGHLALLTIEVLSTSGDWNGDGAIAEEDLGALRECTSGSMDERAFVGPSAECLDFFDFDEDGDIDEGDTGVFFESYAGDPVFRRGDCNGDGTVEIGDPVALLFATFLGDFEMACDDACDSNDDGMVDLSDPITTLEVLFLGQGAIPLPGTKN